MDPDFKHQPQNQDQQFPHDSLSNLPPAPVPSYVKSATGSRKFNRWVLLAALLIIVAAAVVSWIYLSKKPQPTKQHATTTKAAVIQKPVVHSPYQPKIPTTSYSIAAFGMSFRYPSTWKIVDSGSAGVTATSPVMSLTAANGQTQQGQVVFNVNKQGALPAAFTANSVAVLQSQRVNYLKPSSTQAAATFISFVQYPATTTKGGLDGIYVTGNYGYQKDQIIPASNVAQVSPLIYFNFYACATSVCPPETRQPLTISSELWQQSAFSAPILMILQSISFD
jgi:hypothetical protein